MKISSYQMDSMCPIQTEKWILKNAFKKNQSFLEDLKWYEIRNYYIEENLIRSSIETLMQKYSNDAVSLFCFRFSIFLGIYSVVSILLILINIHFGWFKVFSITKSIKRCFCHRTALHYFASHRMP